MTKYIITAQTFSGEVYAIYDHQELRKVDFSAAQLGVDQIDWLKRHLPAMGDPMELTKTAKLTIVNEAYAISFEMFWDRYKKAINRKRCLTRWDRMSKADQAEAYAGILKYDRFLQMNPWRAKADPDTYLTNQSWKNDWK